MVILPVKCGTGQGKVVGGEMLVLMSVLCHVAPRCGAGVEWCRGSKSGVPHTHEAACALLAFAAFPGAMIGAASRSASLPAPFRSEGGTGSEA